MQDIRKWGAFLGAGAVILTLAGCADRNKNGQPDSTATVGEVSNSVEAAGDKMAPAVEKAGEAVSNGVSKAGEAVSNGVSKAGEAVTGAAEAATMTPKVKTALGAAPGLAGSKIDVDTNGTKDSIALKGTVKSASQKTLAEKIAKQNAPAYKILNQLKVAK
jgi:osmotically-inducible protein OsmY